ncbi:MAG: hypothetical protein ACI94Y_001568 [Maribacter sp.]|jgi:hypothetical protein
MKKIILLILILPLILSSCKDDNDICPNETPFNDAALYAEYLNSSGPVLNFDQAQSSPIINIGGTATVNNLPDFRIELLYSGVTLKKDREVYIIDELITQEKGSTCWIVDSENSLTFDFSKSLDIVLVIDVSSSLGNNIAELKNNAKTMVTNILNSNPDAQISIVKFSRGNAVESFSSNESTLHQFIDSTSTIVDPMTGSSYQLEGRNETALYESINTAINLLNTSGANGRGILTFTDGVSNFQFDPQFQDEEEVLISLNNSEISHYTIGYEGNGSTVDRVVLENLAVNGAFSFPQNTAELEEIFVNFSNSVAAVYDLRYETNNAVLESPREHRFLFNTTLVSE